ncbi:MAG TPA: hypothetical protein VI893_07920 [Thermoplasmata archaeon]|nr:hypothetical protein [Thermoplasmata archaeon]
MVIETIRKIAAAEAQKVAPLELGIVESVTVRESADQPWNYECSVLLPSHLTPEGKMLKVERVPLLTPHIGLVNPPYPKDLVLVGFMHGEFASPVVLGRLYSSEKRVPLHKRDGFLLQFDPKEFVPSSGTASSKEGVQFQVSFKGGFRIMMKKDEVRIESGDKKVSLLLDKDSIDAKVHDSVLRISKSNGIEMKTKGEVRIEAAKDVVVKGKKIHLN